MKLPVKGLEHVPFKRDIVIIRKRCFDKGIPKMKPHFVIVVFERHSFDNRYILLQDFRDVIDS